MIPQDSLTTAMNLFKTTFAGFQGDFFTYGSAIFFGLLTISIAYKALEYAWTKDITESLPDWIRELVGSAFFWTIMQNLTWLASIPNSANFIGKKYLAAIDPSSIILKGILMSDKIITPLNSAGLFDTGIVGLLIGVVCCVVIMYCMFNIALEVAVTVIVTQGIICISPLFLAAGALKQSSQIARNSIDVVIANSVKLLGFYLVIATGNKSLDAMTALLPATFDPKTSSFDQYCLIIAVVALYFAVAKTFPDQIAKLVTGVIQENRGINAMAAATAALSVAAKVNMAANAALKATNAVGGLLKTAGTGAGSTVSNAMANYREISSSQPSRSMASKLGGAVTQTAGNVAKSTGGAVADKFRDIATRASGGTAKSDVQSVSSRMYQATQRTNAQTQANKTK